MKTPKYSMLAMLFSVSLLFIVVAGTTFINAQEMTISGGSLIIDDSTSVSTMHMVLLDSGSIDNKGSLVLFGDWMNTGLGLVRQRHGKLEFHGEQKQHCQGDRGSSFHDILLNNSEGLIVSDDITVSGILEFQSGKLFLEEGSRYTHEVHQNRNQQRFLNSNEMMYVVTKDSSKLVVSLNSTKDSILIPIGDQQFAPLTVVSNSSNTSRAYVEIAAVTATSPHENTPKPNASGIDQMKKCNHYWTIEVADNDDSTSIDVDFDLSYTTNTGSIDRYIVRRYDSKEGWLTVPSVVKGNTIHIVNLKRYGEFQIGEASSPSTSIAEASNIDNELRVFPNPSSGVVHLNCGTERGSFIIAVRTLSGALIQQRACTAADSGANEVLDLSQLARGVYQIFIVREGLTKQMKTAILQ